MVALRHINMKQCDIPTLAPTCRAQSYAKFHCGICDIHSRVREEVRGGYCITQAVGEPFHHNPPIVPFQSKLDFAQFLHYLSPAGSGLQLLVVKQVDIKKT